MDETTKEIEFGNYLEKIFGESLKDSKITLWGHKHTAVIKDENLFNNLARAFMADNLKKTYSLHYYVEFGNNSWSIALDNDLTKKFKEKYGENYTFN